MTSFSKLVVAKFSPDNGCFARDGEILFVKPASQVKIRQDSVSHHFVSTADGKTRSKYGWIREVKPFTIDEFIARYLPDEPVSADLMSHLQLLLTSAARVPADKPVAATYRLRGMGDKQVDLDIHRVVFYPGPE